MAKHDHHPHDRHPSPTCASVFVLHGRVSELHAHAETSHTEHALSYLVDGWFRMEHGRTIEVQPGCVTVVPAGVPHRPLEGRDLEYWMVSFCPSCVGFAESQLMMSPFRRVRTGALPVVEIAQSRRERLVGMFQELAEECHRSAADSPELVRAMLTLILGECRRATPMSVAKAAPASLASEALEFIHRHCLEGISLEDVAAAVCRSPAHVAVVVKKETGFPVGDWIRSGRISEAINRLAHTDDTLDQIAADIGWNDKTHFIRQFRKVEGVTPAAWRRAHRARHQASTASETT